MFAANLVKYISRRASASVGYIIEPLTDAFLCIGAGGNVEQALIGFGVLHDSRRLPLYRKHHRALALFKLFHEVAGPAAEGRQRIPPVPGPCRTHRCWRIDSPHLRTDQGIDRSTLAAVAADSGWRTTAVFGAGFGSEFQRFVRPGRSPTNWELSPARSRLASRLRWSRSQKA